MTVFSDFGLQEDLQKAIEDMGFETPTEIQQAAIPYLLKEDRDIIALAQTGTGKTAAFGLPLLQKVDISNKDVQVIVLCPTRELCMQLAKDLESYSKYQRGMKITSVYGGTDISKQIKILRNGVHIVVGTPGRTLDLINRRKLNLHNIEFVVFDEADEMLSMGFKDDMDAILQVTPEQKQVLLFSATMPSEIAKMAKRYMNDPHEISIGFKNTGNKDVEHIYYEVSGRRKYEVLKRIADINPGIYGIVFCRTRAETKDIAAKLGQDGYSADAIHGDLSQSQRDMVMDRFRSKQIQILVATDVAARGIDVQDLSHVINYNLPDELATYTHRSGRTGRAGNTGISIILASGRDRNKLRAVENKIKRPLNKAVVPSGKEVVKSQLMHKINALENAEISVDEMIGFLPEIYEKLEQFSKEEIIQKFVSLEFKSFLQYYKNADDLNDSRGSRRDDRDRNDRGRRDRGRGRNDRGRSDRMGGSDDRGSRRDSYSNEGESRSRGKYSRFYINLGEKNRMNAKNLLGIINKHTPGESLEIGKIEILKGFSFFEVEEKSAHLVTEAMNNKKYEGSAIIVKPVSASEGRKSSSKRDNRSGSYKKKKHRKGEGSSSRRDRR